MFRWIDSSHVGLEKTSRPGLKLPVKTRATSGLLSATVWWSASRLVEIASYRKRLMRGLSPRRKLHRPNQSDWQWEEQKVEGQDLSLLCKVRPPMWNVANRFRPLCTRVSLERCKEELTEPCRQLQHRRHRLPRTPHSSMYCSLVVNLTSNKLT